MSDLNRIEQNNAELRECIEIAESLPDAPQTVNGYDIATMQKFIDGRSRYSALSYLFAYYSTGRDGVYLTTADLEWLSHMNLSKQLYADYMFYGCLFSGVPDMEIPSFDTSNVVSMQHMFDLTYGKAGYGYHIKLPALDISKAGNLDYICYYASLVEFPNWDFTKKQVSLPYAFAYVNFKNKVIGNLALNTGSCAHMFEKSNITYVGNVTLRRETTSTPYIACNYMFAQCSALKELPTITTEFPLFMSSFMSSTAVTSIPEHYANITLSATDFSDFAYNCTSLVTAYIPNTTNATRIDGLVSGCTNLERIHNAIDFRNASYASSTFKNCSKLSYVMIKNLKANLQLGSGTSYGHLLTVDCLINACYELRDTGSVKTLTIGSANLEKLASVYVRSIEITDAMRAEDDLIDEKLPFERCESTDEGATLISDYILAKNWKLA